MKVLITGGSGFIGTNITSYFAITKQYEVLNIDIVPPKDSQLNHLYKKVDVTCMDDFKKVTLAFNPDYIIHLAARTDLDGISMEDYEVTIKGVRNLMEIIQELPSLKKIIITSSMLVCRVGYRPENQYDYNPTTFYGKSKVQLEREVWKNQPHCDWAIIRPTSIWGPWFDIPYRNFFDMLISRRYFHIGKRSCEKTYGYIGNSVYQIEQLLFAKTMDEKNKVFYIGDEPATNIEDWANEIAQEIGEKVIRMPYAIVKAAAVFGDMLKLIGIHFPMTSFRLKNMTTDNLVDLTSIIEIAPNLPYSRRDGIRETLTWLGFKRR
jgi:nucleoside-diphosphate-sugar epimerase